MMRIFVAVLIVTFFSSFCFCFMPLAPTLLRRRSCNTCMNLLPLKAIQFERINSERGDFDSKISKPLLLFLPGLGGKGFYSSNIVHAQLSQHYDCWHMMVDTSDRSSFNSLAESVFEQISLFPNASVAVLMGESFGGLLAMYVSTLTLKHSRNEPSISIEKLVVVNPATSYDRTSWPTLGPLIANSGSVFPGLGVATIAVAALQPQQLMNIGRQMINRINSTNTASDEISGLLQSFSRASEQLPSDTLQWRLKEWLLLGTFLMNDRFSRVSQPTLIITGGRDRLLPSGQEGKRLLKILTQPNHHNKVVDLVEFPNKGHAILDRSFDLLSVLKSSAVFHDTFNTAGKNIQEVASAGGLISTVKPASVVSTKSSEPIDYYQPVPSDAEIAQIDNLVAPLEMLLSPVFLSKAAGSSRLVRGLGPVPTGLQGRPVLLVGNHQLLGVDLVLLIRQFIREKGILPRGLAHPAFFTDGIIEGVNASKNDFGIRNIFTRFGAVEVSPGSIFGLMKINSTVLLFPGGVREAYHGKNEEYKIFWPEKVDFVRMATLMDAIIVPFAAIGMAETVDIVLDTNEMLQLPLAKELLQQLNSRIPQARMGGNETFFPPLAVPSVKGPARNYFLFQQPYDTRLLNIYNKTECKQAYQHIRGEVESGLEELLALREKDQYQSFLPRFTYERLNGKQAPTAALI